MGFKLYWRGDEIYSRKHNDPFEITSYVNQHKRPVIEISHIWGDGKLHAGTEINTWAHLDKIFEALIEFERYGGTLKDEPKKYALSRGVKVSTITNERFD